MASGRSLARLLKGLRHDQKANLLLDRPAVTHELDRQSIQQFRMRRPLAINPEIVCRGDDAASEHVKPDPISHDACSQRICRACDQVGNLKPAAAECFHAVLRSSNELEKAAWNDFPGMIRVPGRQHREVVARFEVRCTVKRLGRGDARFSQAIVLDESLQSRSLVTGIGNQPVFHQPTNPARIVIGGLARGPAIQRLTND